jgi:carbonic anhydrase/acetyltransferase-like protein (isoleucine patch superfamily)
MEYMFKGKSPQLHPTVYVAPGVQLIGDIEAAENVSIWFNTVIRADNAKVTIGKGSNIQDGSILHVDPTFPLVIGEHVTVGHGVILHGCTVEDGALIGMGSTVLNGAVIGAGAIVGAGALVPEGMRVPPGTLAVGVPAKVIRELTPENIERAKRGAHSYVQKGGEYKDHQIG